MNTQTNVSEADILRITNLQLRQQLMEKDRAILALEQRLLQAHLHATYGNSGEELSVAPDGSIGRSRSGAATP